MTLLEPPFGHSEHEYLATYSYASSCLPDLSMIQTAAMPTPAADVDKPGSGSPDPKERMDTVLFARLQEILEYRALNALFQPIINMKSGEIIGYEGLIRGPSDSPLHSPLNLFKVARENNMTVAVEYLCRQIVLQRFAELKLPGKLFLNVSPECLLQPDVRHGETLDYIQDFGINPKRVIIELTESQPAYDYHLLRKAAMHYRNMGFQIAIDDLGEGFSSLRLWSELRPEYVKIDMHFIQGINKDPVKLQFVQSIQEIAEKTGTLVIAEGIETQAELLLIRDLGIDFGQGYHIARPNGSPARIIPSDVAKALAKSSIAIHPQECIAAPNGQTALRLLQSVPDVEPDTSNNAVYEIFEQDPDLQTVAVVSTGTPVGLITRASMIDRFARVYQRELYGKKPCTSFMDAHPLITDKDTSLQELSGLIVNSDRRHLFNGFIITDQGRFLGVGNSHDLMREITQMQLVAARYANPLTLLPGNVPINEHIDRLLQNRVRFCACYADLDHFKPFNDIHGYRKGDDAIQLTGQLLIENCDPELDFVGHIGGDDFIILFQSEDWEARCQSILQAFETAIAGHYPDDDRARGGYYAEDRQGNRVFHPLVSLSLGAVRVEPEQHSSSHQVASAAAEAKKQAKKTSGNTLFIDRRQALCSAPPAPNESVEPSNKQVVDPYDEKTAT